MLKQATDPFARIANYYDDLVRKYGHDPRACDYGRAQSQEVKFRVLSEVMPLDRRSILDVGCGFGDFQRYLAAHFPGVRYTGIDVCPAMVEEGRRANPKLDLRLANLLDCRFDFEFDVVTANGIFYLLGDDAWPMMQTLVARMYELAGDAVAFNSLSAWTGDKEEGEFYADPAKVVDFCRTLTPWVTLRHDYHPRDFTIYLYKAKRA